MTGRVKIDGPPIFGVTGELTPLKPRADFVARDFERLIDAQGTRLAWARSMKCPCRPRNRQTDQPDPRCPRCRQHPGYTFYGPAAYEVPAQVGALDPIQRALVEQYGASVIRGFMSGVSAGQDPHGKVGPRIYGLATVTVRPQNVLAYYDRLVDLDSEEVFPEIVEVEIVAGVVQPLRTRYPVVALNTGLTENGTTVRVPSDLRLTEAGVLMWRGGHAPANGTRVSLSYLCHTHYRVIDRPHALRRTQVKNKVQRPTTPLGTPTALPIQAALQLEYLTKNPET